MLSTVRSPQFSGYWCIWGHPKTASTAYENVKKVPSLKLIAKYEDPVNGVYAFFSKDKFYGAPDYSSIEDTIGKLLKPYDKLTTENEAVPLSEEAEWIKKNWGNYLTQLRKLSLDIKNSTQFKLN